MNSSLTAVRMDPFLGKFAILGALVELQNGNNWSKLGWLAAAILAVWLPLYMIKLYQARMKFRRLKSRGIVCLFKFYASNHDLT